MTGGSYTYKMGVIKSKMGDHEWGRHPRHFAFEHPSCIALLMPTISSAPSSAAGCTNEQLRANTMQGNHTTEIELESTFQNGYVHTKRKTSRKPGSSCAPQISTPAERHRDVSFQPRCTTSDAQWEHHQAGGNKKRTHRWCSGQRIAVDSRGLLTCRRC